jgi:hypothetical protein
MQLQSPPDQDIPMMLASLPDPDVPGNTCPRRTRFQIDVSLLAIEALNLDSSEAMLVAIQDLQLQKLIKNRVVLWRLRSTNPFRRFSQRRPLGLEEAKALVAIACYLTRQQTVFIRQLLLTYEQLRVQQLPLDQNLLLARYLERFRCHFRSRMNLKRAGIAVYNSDENLNRLALTLLGQLLFCTGTVGMQRFWFSLFDGEAA